MASLTERARRAWSAFTGRDPTKGSYYEYRYGNSSRPDRPMFTKGNARSIVTGVYTQIAVDCARIDVKHVRTDDDGRYLETIYDSLNYILGTKANIDQTGRMFIQDAVMTMLDEGSAALVPTYTDVDPSETDSYQVITARVGKIVQWFPRHVRVSVYNEKIGKRQEILLEKRYTPIISNPFYPIMNEPNSTAKRLMRVLNQLDRSNEHNSSSKLDLIVQLPYQVKTPAKKLMAENRRKDITAQLTGSEYGIAYMDATEKVTQLNRSLENNLSVQADKLQADLYNQLGFSQEIFNGTADEQTQLNYYNRTIEPIMSAIAEAIATTWLSKTAQTQNQSILYFRDPFKLIPVAQLAELSDKLTRNEIMTSNEIRVRMGLKPSEDPRADQLINANLNHPEEEVKNRPATDEESDGFQNKQ